jgi:hypothetical protein
MRSTQEASGASIKMTEEAVCNAYGMTESANKMVDAAITTTREATEASKRMVEETAAVAMRAFDDLIKSIENIRESRQQIAGQIGDIPAENSHQIHSRTEETQSQTLGKEVAAKPVSEVVSKPVVDAKIERESKEIRQIIESRLESLSKMYFTNEAQNAGYEDEE